MWWRPDDDIPVHAVDTPDGWRLPVREYPGPGGKGTIYLQHGLGASQKNFDLHPHGPSLARWLAARGWRVFTGDLRGRAAGPSRTWRFSDYLLRDMPALCGFVRKRAGERVHLIGHSMGGILGLSHAGLDAGAQLASVTSLGSALHFGLGSNAFSQLLPLRPLISWLPGIPNVLAHRLLGPLWALKLLPSWHYRRANMDIPSLLAFHAHAASDISIAELLELASTFSGEGILCEELGRRLPEIAAKLPVPWLCVAGELDSQCPPVLAEWTYQKLTAPRKQWLLCKQYGHYDLAGGRDAARDVWPQVESFVQSVPA